MNRLAAGMTGVVVVLGAAWAGLAGWTGYRLEREIQASLQQPLALPALGTLSLLSYQRGWLTSQARYRLTLTPDAGTQQTSGIPTAFDIDATLAHGPWPLARLREAALAPVLARAIAQPVQQAAWQPWFAVSGGVAPLTVTADLAYTGTVSFQANLAAIQIRQPEGQLTTSGARITGQATPGLQQLQLQGQLAEARVVSRLPTPDGGTAPTELRLTNVHWHSQQQRGLYGLYPGDAELRVGRLEIDTRDDQGQPLPVVAHQYQMRVDLTENAPYVSGLLDYRVDQVSLAQVELGEIEAAFRFERLHGPTLRDSVQRYQALMHTLADGQLVPEAREPAFQDWFEHSWRALLPHQPVFALDPLRWELPQGRSWLQIQAQFQPPQGTGPLASIANLDARLVVSRPMATEVLARLSQLPGGSGLDLEQARAAASLNVAFLQRLALASGYVVADQDALMAHLRLADGRLSLNDRPVPVPDDWAPLLNLP